MNKIITIAREYGSGGREVGIKLAEKLGFAFYDKEIISLAAQAGGLDAEFVAKHEEQAPTSFLGSFSDRAFASFAYQPSYSDTIFFKQCDILKEIAAKGNCVIVGRCADYVLRDFDTINVFIYSDMASKVERKRVMVPENEAGSLEELQKKIAVINKGRRKYYEHYTGNRWGDVSHYDLCVNTTKIGADGAVETILAFAGKAK